VLRVKGEEGNTASRCTKLSRLHAAPCINNRDKKVSVGVPSLLHTVGH